MPAYTIGAWREAGGLEDANITRVLAGVSDRAGSIGKKDVPADVTTPPKWLDYEYQFNRYRAAHGALPLCLTAGFAANHRPSGLVRKRVKRGASEATWTPIGPVVPTFMWRSDAQIVPALVRANVILSDLYSKGYRIGAAKGPRVLDPREVMLDVLEQDVFADAAFADACGEDSRVYQAVPSGRLLVWAGQEPHDDSPDLPETWTRYDEGYKVGGRAEYLSFIEFFRQQMGVISGSHAWANYLTRLVVRPPWISFKAASRVEFGLKAASSGITWAYLCWVWQVHPARVLNLCVNYGAGTAFFRALRTFHYMVEREIVAGVVSRDDPVPDRLLWLFLNRVRVQPRDFQDGAILRILRVFQGEMEYARPDPQPMTALAEAYRQEGICPARGEWPHQRESDILPWWVRADGTSYGEPTAEEHAERLREKSDGKSRE